MSQIQTETQEKPKHKRRSRRSLVWQIAECHFLIDKELASAVDRPSRLTLLKAKLESLMRLLEREDRAKEATPTSAKVETTPATTSEPTSQPDPLDDIVAGMLKRHANQGGTPAIAKPCNRATPRPTPAAPVSDTVADLIF